MKEFKNKQEIHEYIIKKFSKKYKAILIRSSTAKSPAKKFSDFDIEAYGEKTRKPYYEIAFLKNKPILITVYFEKYKNGKKSKPPQNIKLIHGEYNKNLIPRKTKEKYNHEERTKRECQIVVDCLFKYMRNGDIAELKAINKRIKDP